MNQMTTIRVPGSTPVDGHSAALGGLGMKALEMLIENSLEPTPENYRVAYLYVSKSSDAIMERLRSQVYDRTRITQDDMTAADMLDRNAVNEIHNRMPANDKATQAMVKRFSDRLRIITDDTSQSTRRFGDRLKDQRDGAMQYGLPPEIETMVEAMIETTVNAEQQLEDAKARINDLENDLNLATDMAGKDAMTGLPNRRNVEARLAEIKDKGDACTIVMADIDHFKDINDEFGHDVGDRVIKAVGELMRDALTPYMVGRWGGEEFIAVVEADAETAQRMCEQARIGLENKNWKVRENDKPMHQVTISMGISTMTRGTKIDASIKEADERLYKAKNGGRNRICVE